MDDTLRESSSGGWGYPAGWGFPGAANRLLGSSDDLFIQRGCGRVWGRRCLYVPYKGVLQNETVLDDVPVIAQVTHRQSDMASSTLSRHALDMTSRYTARVCGEWVSNLPAEPIPACPSQEEDGTLQILPRRHISVLNKKDYLVVVDSSPCAAFASVLARSCAFANGGWLCSFS